VGNDGPGTGGKVAGQVGGRAGAQCPDAGEAVLLLLAVQPRVAEVRDAGELGVEPARERLGQEGVEAGQVAVRDAAAEERIGGQGVEPTGRIYGSGAGNLQVGGAGTAAAVRVRVRAEHRETGNVVAHEGSPSFTRGWVAGS